MEESKMRNYRILLALVQLSACASHANPTPSEAAAADLGSTEGAATSVQSVSAVVVNTASQPVPMQAIGTTTIAGQVSAAQGGAWSVNAVQDGAWTVGIAGTPSVTVVGPVTLQPGANVSATLAPGGNTVEVGNTVQVAGSVGIAGTPTVAVSSLPPVTGSVGIVGTPSVALAPGTSVAVAGTPSVTVANPQGSPIPVAPAAATTSLITQLEVPMLPPQTSDALDVSKCRTVRVLSIGSSSDYHLEVDAYATPTFLAGVLDLDVKTHGGTAVFDTPGALIKLVATSDTPNVLVWVSVYCRP
jgi:hypothetical protein